MNYVELHIGDYDKATAHLTACEDGIYGRLLRRYYDTEAPLPLDLKVLQRLVRARAKDEREAVETVLDEFFQKREDGWHHPRCDEEIAKYQEAQGEREEKKQHETERKRRYRQRRSELFAALRDHGIVPPFETPIEELEAMLSLVLSQGTDTGTGHGRPRKGTATQTPSTRHQTPDTSPKASDSQTEVNTQAATGTDAHVLLALGLRRAGFLDVTVMLDELGAAASLGIDAEDLVAVAMEGRRKQKKSPGRWALTTAIARHQNGEPIVQDGTGIAPANKQQQLEQRNRAVGAAWASQPQEDIHATE